MSDDILVDKAKVRRKRPPFMAGEIVLGKVRGYPPWPGMVVDPSAVPRIILKERPDNSRFAMYCIQFFPLGDFAWVVGRYIEKLDRHDIESYISEACSVPSRRERELLEGYRVALDPRNWLEDWKLSEEKEKREKRMKRAKRAKQRVLTERDVEEAEAKEKVEMEVEVEERPVSINLVRESEDKTLSRKRERMADNSVPSTVPNVEPVAEIGVGIDPTSSSEKDPQLSTKKVKREVTMEVDENEDLVKTDGTAHDDSREQEEMRSSPITTTPSAANLNPSKIPSNAEAFDAWFWRHQLQRAFCGSDLLKDEEMHLLDKLFLKIETYDEMTVMCLRSSKIHKVMRLISKLSHEKVPSDDEFRFRARASTLVGRWQAMLESDGK